MSKAYHGCKFIHMALTIPDMTPGARTAFQALSRIHTSLRGAEPSIPSIQVGDRPIRPINRPSPRLICEKVPMAVAPEASTRPDSRPTSYQKRVGAHFG